MGEKVNVDGAQSQTHMSADDLNDGFILDKNDQKTLSYQVTDHTVSAQSEYTYRWSFRPSVRVHLFVQDGKWNITEESGDEDNEEDEEEKEDSVEEEESAAENDDDDDQEEEENEEEGSSEEEDGHSDLESEESGADDEAPEEEVKTKKIMNKEELKAEQEAAKAELPYTFAGDRTIFCSLRLMSSGAQNSCVFVFNFLQLQRTTIT